MRKRSNIIPLRRHWNRSITLALLVSLCLLTIYKVKFPRAVQATSSGVVISQVYGGGGNSSATLKNDFIELFNRGTSSVNITGWSVQYTASTGTTWQSTALSGSIAPGQYYLVQEAQGSGGTVNLPLPDAAGTIAMSAAAGKVALVNSSTFLSGACPSSGSIIDLIGFGGANCSEGTSAPALSSTTAALRSFNGCTDTDNNGADFTAVAPNPRNTTSPANVCSGSTPTNPSGVGAASPASVSAGESTLLTVAVSPGANPVSTGLLVTGNLAAIGGSAAQKFFDDGSNGDSTPSDNIFSFRATVSNATSSGVKNLPMSLSDAQSRGAGITIALTVQPPGLAIHEIQGSGARSPHVGEVVTTTGIVTAHKNNGFFLQTPDSSIDNDPNTSEGIFVFTSTAPPAAAVVGNAVTVTGTVQEFVPSFDPGSPPLTEISGFATVVLTSTGHALPNPISISLADTNPSGSLEQLEKYEGMRVHVDSLTVIAPTQGTVNETSASSTSNGSFYGVLTGLPRPLREPGIEVSEEMPAGSPCCVPRFDANPERLRVDSDGQIGATSIEVSSGLLLTNLTGVLDFQERAYTLLPDPAPKAAASGSASARPLRLPAADEFTIASFNLERFFDTTDDPALNEPVLTTTAFNRRLNKTSLAIRNVMRSPDIIGIEEVENRSTLQALAEKLNSDALTAGETNPNYQAYLIEGNDVGGIDVGFLVKLSRVTVMDVTQEGKSATFVNPTNGASETLHDRPPLLLRATLPSPDGSPFAVTVIVNHLRSLSGISAPAEGARIRAKRRAQAEFLANLIQTRQAVDPNERIVSVGDYNSFPFSDGYVDTLGTIRGTPAPFSEVVLASSDLVDPDLTNLIDRIASEERYSFVFDGNAQALDHILVSQNLLPRVTGIDYARSNADFPESFRNEANRPERVSDHDMPVAYFNFPATSADLSISMTATPDPAQTGASLTYSITVTNEGPAEAKNIAISISLSSDTNFDSVLSPQGWRCTAPAVGSSGTVSCSAPSLAASTDVSFSITVQVSCSSLEGSTLTSIALVNSSTQDPNPNNNSSTTITTVSNPAPLLLNPPLVRGFTGGTATSCGTVISDALLAAPIATDNCPGVTVDRSGVPAGNFFPVGTNQVTYTATDSGGRKVTTVQTVSVTDTTPPELRCPDSITVSSPGQSGALLSYGLPSVSDNCPAMVTASCLPPPGSPLAFGVTEVLCSATDASGVSNSCRFTVTVSGPREIKLSVLHDLTSLRSSVNNKRDASKLELAIKHLTEALESVLWIDLSHPRPNKGKKVFEEEKETISKLVELMNNRRSSLRDELLKDFILRLESADRALAVIAINEALSLGGEPRHLGLANDRLFQGDRDVEEGRFSRAVENYHKAWQQALKALHDDPDET